MAPVLAAALPAIIGTIIRATGIAGGAAAVAVSPDEVTQALGGLVTAVSVLWGVVQKIRAARKAR